ncbi:glycosyltransferase [Sporocytophaga myxococcoides]|uniref:glycosyltransferase n=1 Tax=Sporocytophaga myxococcoides TaxID=153721 RepID=UPI000417BBE3|nr:glycosyltransferase [Sporocytophaga myxococcoides]
MGENKNILVLTYWSYNDALVQTYTLPYVKIMKDLCLKDAQLFLVTFEQKKYQELNKKSVSEDLQKKGLSWLPLTYNRFGLRGILRQIFNVLYLIIFCKIKKIDTIHSFCTPAGSMAYVLSRLLNIELIIDSYEPHAETMVETGTWKSNGLAFRILFKLEQLQGKRAKKVITTTEGMKEYAREKYKLENTSEFFVKPACVDLQMFDKSAKKNKDLLNSLDLNNKIVCVYAGKFGSMYLEQEVFDFFKAGHDYWKDKFKVLLLTSHSKEEILKYCMASNLDPDVVITRFVPHSQIPLYIGLGDFGLTPFKPVPSKRYGSPIKTGEYWAMGLPVVITEFISDNSELIEQNGIGSILRKFNPEGYISAIREIDSILKTDQEALFYKIRSVAEKYRSYDIAKKVYQQVYCG